MDNDSPVNIDPREARAFRAAVLAGRQSIGCFIKTHALPVVEILGLSGLDFAVLDAEHAPFGLREIDLMVPAARSVSFPLLVRTPAQDMSFIAACLDLGVQGVLVPHVCDARSAEQVVQAVKFSEGKRGLSPSPRAARYGTQGAVAFAASSDASTSVWCQIEDQRALRNIEAICAVPGVDCLFVGPVDLAQSLGRDSPRHPVVRSAIVDIAVAAKRASMSLGIFATAHEDIAELRSLGFNVFVCGSDQSYLLGQARTVVAAGRNADEGTHEDRNH